MGFLLKYFSFILTALIAHCAAYPLFATDQDLHDRLIKDTSFLCSPLLAGRAVPGETGNKTAEWIAEKFSELDLPPAISDTSYFQAVSLLTGELDKDASSMLITRNESVETLKWGEGFYTFPKLLTPVNMISEPVFCRYGISSEQLKRKDFEETAGKAAIVMAGSGELPRDKAGRLGMTPFKAAAAKRAGATILIECYPLSDGSSWPPPKLENKIRLSRTPLVGLPNRKPGFSTVYIWSETDASHQFDDWVKIELRISFKNIQGAYSNNVVARLNGKIPEFILVGAHYDHLGRVLENEKEYYPGADDNASGVAGLLELARRWSKRELTERGVILVAFSAEEDGMLGSNWFVEHSPVPLESITAMINLDVIGGRGFGNMRDVMNPKAVADSNYAAAYYSGASPALRDVLRAAGANVDLDLQIQPVNSFSHFGDAGPFNEAQIPTMHLFSGFRRNYHEPQDSPDKLDFEKMAKMIDLADAIISNLLEGSGRIGFDPDIKVERSGMPH